LTMEKILHPAARWVLDRIFTFSPPYRVAK
jgi:hypothetical protein